MIVGGHWEQGVGLRPAVEMKPTIFRTHVLNAVGAPNAAIAVVGGFKTAQRVVFQHGHAGASVFVSASSGELDGPGGLAPAGAYTINPDDPVSMVVAPGQGLMAAASVAGLRLSVSVSQVVPIPPKGSEMYSKMQPATFQTHLLTAAGIPGAAVRISRSSTKPQRILVSSLLSPGGGGLIYVASGAEGTLDTGLPAGPIGFAYELQPDQPTLFVTAPGQSLDAVSTATGARVSVHASEISLQQALSPSGIPGPGGEG